MFVTKNKDQNKETHSKHVVFGALRGQGKLLMLLGVIQTVTQKCDHQHSQERRLW